MAERVTGEGHDHPYRLHVPPGVPGSRPSHRTMRLFCGRAAADAN